MCMTWGQMGGFGMMGMMFVSGLIGLALLVLIVVAIVRLLSPRPIEFRGTAPDQRRDVLAILDERYARGEIDDEEYERRRRLLSPK